MATEQDDVIAEPKASPPSNVGSTLKATREAMGKDLPEVASQLRIRLPYLAALEDGRHKDLPGGTYAVGFLRTYADFLGLDGEEMVRRFKQEAAGDLTSRAELIFPSPVSEGRIPGGALLFLGLVLAAAAYGGWYWLNARDTSIAEMVPPIPERLSAVKAPAEPPPAQAEPKAEEPRPDDAKSATGEVVPPAEDDDKPPAPAADARPAPVPVTAAVVEAAKPPAAPPAVETAKAEPKPAEADTKPEPAMASEAPTSAPAPAPAPAADPKVIGEDNIGARIVLTAAGDDCWVQVREMDGQLLLSRLLRKGDSYRVPDRPGLNLMVGNAGALEISVDGKPVPSLGAAGQVRRDIKLDPDKLTAGG